MAGAGKNASKVKVSWNEFQKMSEALVAQIKKSGFAPDYLVAVSRGGLVPATIISHQLENKNLLSVKAEYYEFDNFAEKTRGTKPKPVIAQGFSQKIAGKKVLVIDEILDTGATMKAVVAYLKKKNPAQLKVAVIHSKPWAKFKPDYEVKSTDKWVVYPWGKK